MEFNSIMNVKNWNSKNWGETGKTKNISLINSQLIGTMLNQKMVILKK